MRKPRIYLAGGSSEAELVATYVAKVRLAGFHITYDWSEHVLSRRALGVADAIGRADSSTRRLKHPVE